METCDRNGNCINDAPTYAQEQLADIERRKTVDHPSYYKRGGIEAIDAIEAWGAWLQPWECSQVHRPRRVQDRRQLARPPKSRVVS